MSAKTYSQAVSIQVLVETEGYQSTITAKANWLAGDEPMVAKSVREIDLYKAKHVNGVSVEEFVEATKRDALRELVTQLNLHKVL